MHFDELDRRLRVYETAHDHRVLPGLHMVARLDGRSFTRLTRETLTLAAPYDERFRDAMVATVVHLMDCGFRVVYGYTQSDEISLLMHRDEQMFDRKLRKYLSILAGEASGVCSLHLNHAVAFDCRIAQLPGVELVADYFRWRSEDAHRNALNGHCYWLLRGQGQDAQAATRALRGMSIAQKNELLFQHGTNFNDLPAWQRRGIGVRWGSVAHTGHNPLTGEAVETLRSALEIDMQLPVGDAYAAYVRERLGAR